MNGGRDGASLVSNCTGLLLRERRSLSVTNCTGLLLRDRRSLSVTNCTEMLLNSDWQERVAIRRYWQIHKPELERNWIRLDS